MTTLTITAIKGVTIRTGPSTSGGAIRSAPLGTVLEFVNVLKAPNGDRWAQLGLTDPKTGEPWRFGGAVCFAFVAVYVNGVKYADAPEIETPGVDERAVIEKCIRALEGLL